MYLYQNYMRLWREGLVNAGFSPRLPDVGIRYWLEQMERAIDTSKPKTFLDIGAGDGRLSLLMLRSGYLNGAAIEVQGNAKSWQAITDTYGSFHFYDGLLQEHVAAMTRNQKFDFVLLSEVFEHIPLPDVSAFLQALHAVLSDDGCVFLTTPNFDVQGPAEQSAVWHEREPYGHYKHYRYQELEALLKAHGFSMVWHAFECHKFKSKLYNKWFYPLSRLDAKLLSSKKLPSAVRAIYRYLSAPFISLVRGPLYGMACAVHQVEKRWTDQQSGATMMMCIKKD